MVAPTYPEAGNQVAVVGMAGRFPGARDVDELWRNLRDGVESVTFFGDEELAAAGVDPERMRRPEYVAARGLLEGIDEFDAGFFGYSPLEARIMDPQQRIFLQAAWHALEDAGYGGAAQTGAGSDRGAVGLYAACGINNYLLSHLLRNPTLLAKTGAGYVRVANRLDNLATRTAYKLDLRGPAINVQTGCSSSLVAVHLACQSLLGGESDLALAGGIRINLLSREGYVHEEGSVLSPDGHTRTFDAGARGTIAADGVGVVVLKRLDQALEDGDTVRAVILGSAANNDGSEKIGYTAPSVEGQARVVSEALAMAGVEADSLSYVEAHGTATPLGDPIEVAGLTRAFRGTTDRRGFCALGSVKSNFGHLDTAAGVAGLIKTVLALEHEALPPSLHFQTPNPEIDFAASPFRVVDRLTPWPRGAAPRRAGVSSFGIGGTNVHVVAQEAPPAPASEPSRPWQLLALSARSPRALEDSATALGDHLRERSELHLADVAHTLAAGRRAFEHRRVLVVADREQAVAGLGGEAMPAGAAFDLAGQLASVEDSEVLARPVAFLFPGQGAQRPGMAVDLYRQEPTFRADLERCGELLAPHLERGLAELLAPAPEDGDGALADTGAVQPALFAVEWALARLFLRWGVRPAALAGHSLGEYVAACLAGVLSLPDALALVATRGRLMQDLPAGAMLVVPLAEAEVRERLGDGLELAAVNGPALCVVTGEVDAVAELEEALRAEGLEPRRLRTRRAFHSALVEPMMEPFARALQQVELRPPEIPYLSNVTGTWITPAQATDPDYWLRHLRRPVRFGDCLEELLAEPGRVLLEVGPGRTLCTLARRSGAWAPGHFAVPTLPGSADAPEGLAPVLAAAGRLWCGGAEVDLAALHGGERRRRVPLPGYPFERQSYWVEPEPGASFGDRGRRAGAERRPDPAEWFHAPSWKRLPPARPGAAPGTAWLVLADGAAGEALARELARRPVRRPEADGGIEVGGTEVGGTEVGATVVTVRPVPGAGLERRGEREWALDPADGEAYRHLLSVLTEEGLAPDRVVHAWSWAAGADADSGDDSGGTADADAFDRRQETGFHSLVHLVRALTDPGVAVPRRLVVVSSGLDDVLGGEPVDPAALPLLGVARALPYEHPEIECRVVDAGPAGSAAVAEEEGRMTLLAEEVGAATAPAQVALRNGMRWGRHHEPIPLGPVEGLPSRLRRGGVYLLFGGLGRIGLELAGWLVEEAGARLVLAGRSLPPGEDAEGDERARLQDAWLEEHGTDDPGSRRISRLRELRRAGAEVVTCAADVTDPGSVRRAVELARQRFGALHGVVHGAGTTRTFDPLRETTAATAAVHFRPKAHGALALRSALDGEGRGGEGPDFVLLLSSLSAAVGGVGYAAHAAAHAALDAFALDASRRAAGRGGGTPWLSVGLDGWAFGKRGDTAGSAASGRRGGARFALAPEEGVEVIRRFLDGAPVPHLVVSTADLEERAAARPACAAEVGGEPAAEPGAGDAGQHARPALTTAYVAPEGETEELIAALWQDLLGVDRVGVGDDFFELGGHSLLGVRLVSRLREAFHVEIPMRRVMEQTTVRGLAGTVEEALLAEIEQLSDEEAERLLEEAH